MRNIALWVILSISPWLKYYYTPKKTYLIVWSDVKMQWLWWVKLAPNQLESLENFSCVDLELENCSTSFKNCGAYKNWLSNFHKMTVVALKMLFRKQKPNTMLYRNYKNFRNKAFWEELDSKLFKYNIWSMLYGIPTNFEYIFQVYLQRKNWGFQKVVLGKYCVNLYSV